MMSRLVLNKAEGDFAEALADCKVGDTKTFEVEVTVTRDDSKMFEADVVGVTYGDEAEPTPESESGEETPEPPAPEPAPTPKVGPQSPKLKY